METITKDSTYESWLAWYTERFLSISNDALKGYWYAYGRETEADVSPRDLAAWAAVNHEMHKRRL